MWTIRVSEDASVELDSWNAGFRGWRRDVEGREAITEHLQVTVDWLLQHPELSVWLATAPEECVQAARPFSSWAPRLLSLASRFNPCRQLLLTNPNLLWLAAWAEDHDEVVAQAVAAGPLALLAALGLRHRPSSLRMLKRLRFEPSVRWQRQALLEWLQPDSLHWGSGCRHQTLLPSTLLLLRKAPRLLHSSLAPALQELPVRKLRQLLPNLLLIYQVAIKAPERLRQLRRHSQLHSLPSLYRRWQSEDRYRQLIAFYREQRIRRVSLRTDEG
ncbi:MAG: hypothetical protein KAY06_01150 [Aeromonadaceae bacterium]|nr:hypothetical protein [Aeromonadaceae bacterium]